MITINTINMEATSVVIEAIMTSSMVIRYKINSVIRGIQCFLRIINKKCNLRMKFTTDVKALCLPTKPPTYQHRSWPNPACRHPPWLPLSSLTGPILPTTMPNP
mmetsp:Transcript_23626/g.50563  ORF Transcript_23626/g.50563 Transcript_23626/m.50563 type:complete len:104 (-) Transcript_23626:720-1031(-)